MLSAPRPLGLRPMMASTGRWYTSIFPKLGSFLNSPVGIDTLEHCDIWTVNPDGTGATPLTNTGAAGSPAWSPDGNFITFTSPTPSSQGGGTDVYVMRSDGTEQHLLYNGRENLPTHKANFSPDGKKILFGCWSFTNQSNDICVMDVKGTNVVDIISTPDFDENFPSWGTAP